MAILTKLQEVLDGAGIDYEVLNHPMAFTAQEVAGEEHIPGKEFAKVVMVKADDRSIMTVLPAPDHVNLRRLSRLLDTPVRLATEEEFSKLFPGCEPGAMPPFGNLFGIDVFMEKSLTLQSHVTFNAGNHMQSIRLRTQDFILLVHPRVGVFSNLVVVTVHPGKLCKSESCA
jgi:Ala-tRNA(Pro) deacylase